MYKKTTLDYINYKKYPELLAKKLNISLEAVQLYQDCEVIDPHTVTYLWKRLFGYNLAKKHIYRPFGIGIFNQVDFPKVLEANMSGVVWDITTNPIHHEKNRFDVLRRNIDTILDDIQKYSTNFQFVRNYKDYLDARKNNKVASFISIQGGQGIQNKISDLDKIPEVHRITLVHFTHSKIGISNFETNKNQGLSDFGKNFVEKMVNKNIMVDLSHINRKGFFDALDVMPKNIPAVVTHTGIKGVRDIWRNIDDEQIKAIAERNGTIGIIYEPRFLTISALKASTYDILDHMEHVIKTVGEDYVTLGSDYDGFINTPKDLKDITYQPIFVQRMLDKNWKEERIRKILGKNFLRAIELTNGD
ncbi:MAG: membrane dipeptidase [Candidatus Sericytochromatia bacterium]